jgi:hypothetical protein
MRRLACALVASAAVIGPVAASPVSAVAAARPSHPAACSTRWGTGAKHRGPVFTVSTPVLRVRAGQHPCFDRLVVDLGRGPRPGFRVRYVARILAEGSGMVLRVRGGARLLIVISGPAGAGYHPRAVNLVSVTGFAVFRQVRGAGSFERVTSMGLGVRHKLPFRAFEVRDRARHWRLVVDVAR